MLFSEQLMVYTRVRIRYSKHDNFLYIMRHLTELLNKDELQNKDDIMASTENFVSLLESKEMTEVPVNEPEEIDSDFEW